MLPAKARVVFVGCVLLIVNSAIAATYSVPAIELSNESPETIDATFDFGFDFSRIDSIRIEVQNNLETFPAFCGAVCRFSYLSADVTYVGDSSAFQSHLFFPDGHYPKMYGEFMGVASPRSHFDPLMRAMIYPPISGFENWAAGLTNSTDEFRREPWPEFMLSGSGVIRVSHVTVLDWGINGDYATELRYRAPIGLTDLRIVVEGVAAPEPTTIALVMLGLPLLFRARAGNCLGAR